MKYRYKISLDRNLWMYTIQRCVSMSDDWVLVVKQKGYYKYDDCEDGARKAISGRIDKENKKNGDWKIYP